VLRIHYKKWATLYRNIW